MDLVTTQQLLAFGLAAFIIIAIPGPSVLFVIGRALAYGRAVALLSVLGNSLGLLTVMTLVALGLGPVVAESAVVFTTIKLAGAGYMVWLGVQAFRHRRAIRVDDVDGHGADGGAGWGEATMRWQQAVRQGFVVGVSNPKAFMMFAAVLPQFVEPASGQVAAQMFVLGLLAFTIGLLSDGLWGFLAAQMRHWFNASPARGRALGAVGGVSMVGLGVGLALTGRPE
jgi:threonine/homoserine/homoserine lactone efflux protein